VGISTDKKVKPDSTRLDGAVNRSYSRRFTKTLPAMTQPVLISDPARITAAWLTEVLNFAGFEVSAQARSVRMFASA